jgi:hypothetical protein
VAVKGVVVRDFGVKGAVGARAPVPVAEKGFVVRETGLNGPVAESLPVPVTSKGFVRNATEAPDFGGAILIAGTAETSLPAGVGVGGGPAKSSTGSARTAGDMRPPPGIRNER